MDKEIYDLEVFPNFFSACFQNVDSKVVTTFVVYNDIQQLPELLEFIKGRYLIGYNNSKYDDLILNYLLLGKTYPSTVLNITNKLYELSQLIISNHDGIYKNSTLKELMWYKKPYSSLDLMSIHRFDKLKVGLKQVSVNLKWHKIQDLPKPYDSQVLPQEVDDILKYNLNDVEITERLFEVSLNEIKLRQSIGKTYDVDIMSASRPKIADTLMNKFYSEFSGLQYKDFKDLRDDQKDIDFKDIIWDKISFKTPYMQKILLDLKNTSINVDNVTFSKSIIINKCKHDMAAGGLHSNIPADIVVESDEIMLIDLDFSSFYPLIMLMLEVYPPHLGKAFLEVLKFMTEQRLKAKKNKNKTEAEALKISINSLYGKLGFEHGYIYSPKSMYTVTINGQLILLMLIEILEEAGFECFYSNTDGATFKVPRSKEQEFYDIALEFKTKVPIETEYAYYSKCIIKNVNNYLIVKTDGEIKEKGEFVTAVALDKGFDMPIVALAIKDYYVNNTPIRQFIENHTDIYDFCKSQKVGGQYKVERHYIQDGKHCIEKLQKTNRYYISVVGDSIYKVKADSMSNLAANYMVTMLNDYVELDNYKINYNYYVHKANEIIHAFDKSQLSLF